MHYLTRPITRLAAWIRDNKGGRSGDYGKTEIAEIRALYDAVSDLTENRRQRRRRRRKKKSGTSLAPQSNTDIIYTYNVEDNSVDIYNLLADGKRAALATIYQQSDGKHSAE